MWLVALAPSALAAAQEPHSNGAPEWTGHWAGWIAAGPDEIGLRLRVGEDVSEARVTLAHFGWYDVAASLSTDEEGQRGTLTFDVYGDRATLELERAGALLRGDWRGCGATGTVELARSAGAAPFEREPFHFANAGHELRATLFMPAGEGPFPAVVWTHGSGRITREDPIYRGIAAWVAEHGIASLVYDKRPPTPDATMEVLADDAVAAVRALREDPRISPERVGVGGMSQGGWISPMAAARSDLVGFVVGLSAPGISPGEQNIFNQRNKVLRAGFHEADADEATRVLRTIYGYLRTGERRDEVWSELERTRDYPWFQSAHELAVWHRQGLPEAPWRYVSSLDLDPGPIWRDIDVPVVCVWGEADSVVPADTSRQRVSAWLAESGNTRAELVVLPSGDHSLRLPPSEPWTMGAVPPGAGAVPRFIRSLTETGDAPPPTRRGASVRELHGVRVPDPYAWLEPTSGERDDWARAQDDYTTRAFAADALVETMRARLVELNEYARAPVPRSAGGRLFFDGQIPGENYTDIRVKPVGGGPERLLVDPHAHPASPDATVALGQPRPSPDGRFAYYGASSLTMPSCVRVVDVESGRDFADDVLPIQHWPWRVSWLADSSGLVYVQGDAVRLHRLGTSVGQDPTLFRSTSTPQPHLAVRASADGEMIFVTAFHPSEDTTRVYARSLADAIATGTNNAWDELIEPTGSFQVVGKRGQRVFVFTTFDAPRGRVIGIDLDRRERAHWVEIVPEAAEAVYDDNHPVRPTVALLADRLVLMYGREGRLLLRIHDLDGELQHEIEHAELGFLESGLVGHPGEAIVRYDRQSMFDPGTAFELDLHTGERRVLGGSQVPFDPLEFTLERRQYPSHDGTLVPVFLAYRRGLVRDGTHAVLLRNSSVQGIVVRPLYLPQIQLWVEHGGVIAIPAARGSGEYGKEWELAGCRRNLVTSLDDLAAAADWLAQAGYSRADRIGIVGASMSAAATAGALVRHPDSFGAGLFPIPRTDLLAQRAWAEVYGDADDELDFAAMMEWMPLVRAVRRPYPAVCVQVGSEDTSAPPYHGYKLVATLQHAQTSRAPTYLQVIWGAGHSQGRGVPQIARTWSLQYAFLARALGLVSE